MKTGIGKAERTILQRFAAGKEVRSSEMPERVRLACERGWVYARFVDVRTSGLRRAVYWARPERLPEFKVALEKAFPGYGEALPADMSRAQAAKLQGNSKLVGQKDGIVLIRDFSGVFPSQGVDDDLLAFRTSTLEKKVLRDSLVILTVENQDSFLVVAPGKAGLPAFDLAVYTAGRPAKRMLRWLGSLKDSFVIHYGDFDFEGLRIYQMVRRFQPEGVCRLHKPEGLREAFVRQRSLGKGAMDNDQKRPKPECAEVVEILALIDEHGRVGVEQQVFDPEA